MSTYIIAGIIFAAIGFVIGKLFRDKMRGKTCNCGSCSQSCGKK